MLYVIGKEFAGFELEALWDDSKFGLMHWHNFYHIAVIADQAWLRAAMTLFTPFFRGEVRIFPVSELVSAKAWIANGKRAAA